MANTLPRASFLQVYTLTMVVIPVELMSQIEEGWQQDIHLRHIIAAKEKDPEAYSKFEW